MSKFSYSVATIVSIFAIFFSGGLCLAFDESGCLTCHQYPGLVSINKDHTLTALHIDAKRYAASAHGRFQCISCHTTIEKVPHTGNRYVDCSTVCHQGKDAKRLPSDYPLSDFHKTEQSFISRLEDKTSCRVCHRLPSYNALISVQPRQEISRSSLLSYTWPRIH